MHYIDMDVQQSATPLREQFPILEETLYVNHAAVSPWPRDTARAVQAYAQEHPVRGPLVYPSYLRTANRLREVAAELINAPSSEDISLLTNTSEGINAFVQGVDWRKGDNVVTLHEDFPSNALPWRALERQGVEQRQVDARNSADPEGALLDRMDGRTRVVAVSSVDWTDGFRLDLQRLGASCRPAGVLLFVDAIQQLGALQLDVQAEEIDVLAAGSHKWQLGPEGMGIFYSRNAVREQLQPARLGWHMLQDRFDFERADRYPARDGRRFEAGTSSRLGQVALLASLRVLRNYGMTRVEERILGNTAQLMAGLESLGMELLSDSAPGRRSGIVTFSVPGVDPGRILSALAERCVYAIGRGGGIRLSPHFYQGAEEMDRLLELIEDCCKQTK